jgi:Tfp pilus assembly protein PilF
MAPQDSSDDRAAAEAHFFEGARLMAEGEAARAEACFIEAIRLVPDFAEAHANRGLLLEQAGQLDEAESAYRLAIVFGPRLSEPRLNLGVLLLGQKRFDEAETAFRHALSLKASADGWSNLGMLYACMHREPQAESCYQSALALDPAHRSAHFNLAYLLLRQGRFAEGWPHFEARDWYAALAARLPCPRWEGEALDGRSILVTYEAGHGDMIQFCRYVPLLKGAGAGRVTLICHPALKQFFQTLEGVDELLAYTEVNSTEGWDCWTPLMSLPHRFGTTVDAIPAPIPYLAVEADKRAFWAQELAGEGLRVGLVWRGNPRFENDAERSLASLDLLAPLAGIAGVRYFSLQKGFGEDEALTPPAGMTLRPLGEQITDFADLAAVVANLDLVISVDSAPAHLAGALGVPCWVLLPDYKTDWRWFKDREDSPWYPGAMRLFRQPEGGGWQPVIAVLAKALEQRVAGSEIQAAP